MGRGRRKWSSSGVREGGGEGMGRRGGGAGDVAVVLLSVTR